MSEPVTQRPDFRTRREPTGWFVDAWARGWEELSGPWPSKRAAVESTRPESTFCHGHWSWLCGTDHRVKESP